MMIKPTLTSSPSYPFAPSPDIIRAHQKDAFFQSVLLERMTTVLRDLYGARFTHTWATETRTAADTLYLCLTTLAGNKTLGEEYCEIVSVDNTGRLPALGRRVGYILFSILLPYGYTRVLPRLRRETRTWLESRRDTKAWSTVRSYVLQNLDNLTSPAMYYALGLAVFYFTGAYYQLAKRVWGLRYIFTRKLEAHEQRGGYQVLGVLLMAQLAVQGYMHVQSTFETVENAASLAGTTALVDGVEVPLEADHQGRSVVQGESASPDVRIQRLTRTAVPADGQPRINLERDDTMQWIQGAQQRKCTLCLEGMKDPSVTTCGHVFCWTCIGDWVREKPECPLCRQAVQSQHILPLR